MQAKSSTLTRVGDDEGTFAFRHTEAERTPRFRGLTGFHSQGQRALGSRYPSLSPSARSALLNAASVHWSHWSLATEWPTLEPFVEEFLALPGDGMPSERLVGALKGLHLQMKWRRAREARFEQARGDAGFFHDSAFVAWLLERPASLLASWARHYLCGSVTAARRDAAFRLSRLRPMPLPILWEWTAFQHEGVAATWTPGAQELRVHGTVSAAAQWLEWWASHKRRYRRPTQQVDLQPAARTVDFALGDASTGRLTIPQEVFDHARAMAQTEVRSAPSAGNGARGTTRAVVGSQVRLHLVSLPSAEAFATPSVAVLRCAVCQQAGAASYEGRRFPPYRIACTCQLALDWERAPLEEAPYDWALARWFESRRAGGYYPFPAMRLLFKLNEERFEAGKRFDPRRDP
jgi:hypothetical protein